MSQHIEIQRRVLNRRQRLSRTPLSGMTSNQSLFEATTEAARGTDAECSKGAQRQRARQVERDNLSSIFDKPLLFDS